MANRRNVPGIRQYDHPAGGWGSPCQREGGEGADGRGRRAAARPASSALRPFSRFPMKQWNLGTVEMLTSRIRIAFGLVSVVLSLGACATPASAGVHATASSQNGTAAVTVTGTMPGYSERDLARTVSSCVVSMAPPKTTQVRRGPQIQVHFESVYTPLASTIVTAELLDDGRVDAVRRKQIRGLASAPSAEACQVVSQLTAQLWGLAAKTSS